MYTLSIIIRPDCINQTPFFFFFFPVRIHHFLCESVSIWWHFISFKYSSNTSNTVFHSETTKAFSNAFNTELFQDFFFLLLFWFSLLLFFIKIWNHVCLFHDISWSLAIQGLMCPGPSFWSFPVAEFQLLQEPLC